MKNFTKILTIVILGLAFSAKLIAQTNAIASAVIITPLAVTKTADMSFGNIIAGPGGTVTLSTSNTRAGAGVTLPAVNAGTVTSAAFKVDGEGNLTYTITLPASHTITRTLGSETMTIDNFTSTPSGTGTLASGTQSVAVGARLTVGAAQVPGIYTNATGFTITVNYN